MVLVDTAGDAVEDPVEGAAENAAENAAEGAADPARRVPQLRANVTLVEGSTFCVCEPDGTILPDRADGLFVSDTRVVSRWELAVDARPVEQLAAIPLEPFECRFVGRAARRAGHVEPTIVVERHRLVGAGMREDLRIRNYGSEPAGITVTITADADFADLFEVKDGRGAPSGSVVEHRFTGNDLVYWRRGPGEQRGVRITAAGAVAAAGTLVFRAVVPAHDAWSTTVEVLPSFAGREVPTHFPSDRPIETAEPSRRMRGWRESKPVLRIAHPVLRHALATSERDLGALRIVDDRFPGDEVVAAGAPWFMTLFGRDALLTGMMLVPFAPELALGTLRALARLQGEHDDPMSEEEPGRILHEVRRGADLSLALGGSGVYYGSIDSTPLFVMLAGRLLEWGVSPGRLAPLRGNIERALTWIVERGDRDGDGFVEYRRSTDRGLENQGWKDSVDSMVFGDGSLARPPIALAEVQGYCYAAFRAGASLLRAWNAPDAASAWDRRAETLRARFHEAFWMPEERYYALALDADKRKVDSVTSNIGHCLWTGIVDDAAVDPVVDRLLSPALFTGFGVRTLASDSVAYNPVSYHDGSVWPHDTVICAAGMARAGRRDAAGRILSGLLAALDAFDGRLPELFCGFTRDEHPVPVPYPTSCSPQAWAAAAPFEMLRIALALDAEADGTSVSAGPVRPASVGTLDVAGVRFGDDRMRIVADAEGATIEPYGANRVAPEGGPAGGASGDARVG